MKLSEKFMVLTKREEEILKWAAKGLADKEIAEKTFVSVRTINAHFGRIYLKNAVKNRAEAVARYYQNYMTSKILVDKPLNLEDVLL